MSIFLFIRTVIYITFLMAWHFAGSVKPIMFSGLMTLMKGKSEFLAICAAKDVLPLLGGPKNISLLHNTSPQVLNFEVKWFKGKTSHESFHKGWRNFKYNMLSFKISDTFSLNSHGTWHLYTVPQDNTSYFHCYEMHIWLIDMYNRSGLFL